MLKKYRAAMKKKHTDDAGKVSKHVKRHISQEQNRLVKLHLMFRNNYLISNALNIAINDSNIVENNIYMFTVHVFTSLLKSKNDKIILKSIMCIKKILKCANFIAVYEIVYEYFRTLFFMDRFPIKLSSLFINIYGDFAKKYDEAFLQSFLMKMNVNFHNNKIHIKKNHQDGIYLLYNGIE